ncbi:competence protein ComEC [Amaricoccus macauensis]|uniref:Competence protein ComEC n=1 Tax=Amaricoccus macauensis TaxID=57001 RepID=A0A840SIW8_9RHOB|nr:ComEC/Rec2 family competence protein [Amaricoccus macauensis]MBB5220710.1 competence protein ComEC [Amaricoccus macauensis]
MGVTRLFALIEAQRPAFALWLPVLFGLGIALYFALPVEPGGWMLAALGVVLVLLAAAIRPAGQVARVALLLVLLPGIGFEVVALRARSVAAPVLAYPVVATVSGRVVGLDRSASDRPRVLLDRVAITGMDPDRVPARVRVSVDPATPISLLQPGLRLMTEARLTPPPAPSEPGAFDYRRQAWFERLGAVGYARGPVVETEGSDAGSFSQLAFRARMAASRHIQQQVPNQGGAFAAAILTGDRSGIDRSVEDALRVSSLYHIVSISGLHMSLLAAAVFGLIRSGLALVPALALRWPLKKIAAAVALVAGLAYLVVSGLDVPAQRSYVMTATVLVAVLLDRPALTMRAVALAGFVVLLFAPESLVQPGFQMSFAATVALIATFEGLRSRAWWKTVQTARGWRYPKPVVGLAMTSLVAGLATGPIAAFHFNTMTQYGLIANLLAMPAMGLVVMPAAVIGVIAAPFGLDWLPFRLAGLGMDYVIAVARLVASFGGAVTGVPAGPPASLALLVLGGIVFVLWIGRGRWAGVGLAGVGLVFWAAHARPDVVIADDGRLFGFRTAAGRVLSGTGNGFAAEAWLREDGDLASPEEAYARGNLRRVKHRIRADVPGVGTVLYVGASKAEAGLCDTAAVLIAPNWAEAPTGRCLFVGKERLRRDGALAIRLTRTGLHVEGARAVSRGRPWTG